MGNAFNCYKCGRELNMLNDRFCCKRLQGDIGQSRGDVVKVERKKIETKDKKKRKYRRSINAEVREQVLKRDGRKCVRCGCKKNLHIHHKVHVEHGGTNDPDNLETLCDICHMEEHREERVYNLMMKSFWEYEEVCT